MAVEIQHRTVVVIRSVPFTLFARKNAECPFEVYTRAGLHPERSEPYPKRVIIFSPHPDDDIISMGGTFQRLTATGEPTTQWLLMFSLFLFLSLAAVKRCTELRPRYPERCCYRGCRVFWSAPDDARSSAHGKRIRQAPSTREVSWSRLSRYAAPLWQR